MLDSQEERERHNPKEDGRQESHTQKGKNLETQLKFCKTIIWRKCYLEKNPLFKIKCYYNTKFYFLGKKYELIYIAFMCVE